MSGVFYLTFLGRPVKLHFQAGKTIADLADEKSATPFTSEAEAWTAAVQHHLQPDHCDVVPAHKLTQEAACS